jgi:glycosyltransferase involved in cell wall biosynthesis
MTVAIVCEHRFRRSAGGEVYTQGPFSYAFWRRYLLVFDKVRVIARVDSRPATPQGMRADGPGVAFAEVPLYQGPWQFLLQRSAVRRSLFSAVGKHDAVILRVPSVLALQLEPWLRRRGGPFAVEVVGDPWDALSPGSYPHALREVFRRRIAAAQRHQCAASCASLYVTARALQRRYPPNPATFSVACSDVHLPPDAFVDAPRTAKAAPRPARVVTVGSLDHLYKGPDLLIKAAAVCRGEGVDVRLIVAGGGRHQEALRKQAVKLGIGSAVCFRGQLTGEEVRRELDAADLFVLPSRQEGLPRALLEAMARASPAVGSNVGGIPELLDSGALVAANDVRALASKIRELLASPARLAAFSERNLRVAREYEESRLERRRRDFLRHVRAVTEEPSTTAACS